MPATTMKAIRVSKFGGPDVMKVEEVPRPTPQPGQVLVQVKAAGVNPVDTYVRDGKFGQFTVPFTPGQDAAGVVAALGQGVSSFKVGDRVYTCDDSLMGAYGEYTAVPEGRVFALPDNVTYSQGASLGIPYFTALRSLVLLARARAGENVLIHGASGGVGLAASQIAASFEMNVFGTAGTEEGINLIRRNGVAHAFNHRDKHYTEKMMEATNGKGFDVILEMLADQNLGADFEMLAERGRTVVVGCRGDAKVNPNLLLHKEGVLYGVFLKKSTDEEWKSMATELARGMREGWVKPVIDKDFPLEKAPEAHKAQMDHKGGAKGKIILTIS